MARFIFAFEGLGNFKAAKVDLNKSKDPTILNFLRYGGTQGSDVSYLVGSDKLQIDLTEDRTYVLYYNFSDWQDAPLHLVQLKLQEPVKLPGGKVKYHTFAVVGHSLGGGAAWGFAHKVSEALHFKFNLGFTIEARNQGDLFGNAKGNSFFEMFSSKAPWQHNEWGWDVPAAKRWINYHQATSGFTGYALPNIGQGNDRFVTPDDMANVSHDNLLKYSISKQNSFMQPSISAWSAATDLEDLPMSQAELPT